MWLVVGDSSHQVFEGLGLRGDTAIGQWFLRMGGYRAKQVSRRMPPWESPRRRVGVNVWMINMLCSSRPSPPLSPTLPLTQLNSPCAHKSQGRCSVTTANSKMERKRSFFSSAREKKRERKRRDGCPEKHKDSCPGLDGEKNGLEDERKINDGSHPDRER